MNNFFLIGLTGNLGSGKSTVRRMLEQRGARGIDADLLAHVAIQRGAPAWFALVREFGMNILKFNGDIDRQKLGARVFANPGMLQRLEEITHPVVRTRILEILRETDASVVVIEAVKLVEAGLHEWCDAVWVVTCAPEIAVERVMRDRKMSADDARARLNAQRSLDAKIKLAQAVIDNSDNEDATRVSVQRAWDAIKTLTARDKSSWLIPGTPTIPMPLPPDYGKPAPIVHEPAPPPATIAPEPAAIVPPTPAAPRTTILERLVPPPAPPLEKIPEPAVPELELRRARKSDLDALAFAFAKRENLTKPLGRAEALQRFGARGYCIATGGERVAALVGWEAENLVAIARDAWAENAVVAAKSLPGLLGMIEVEARALQCEVLLMLVDSMVSPFVIEQARACNFQPRNFQELHPLWRQVAMERIQPKDEIWVKRLREELVTQPF